MGLRIKMLEKNGMSIGYNQEKPCYSKEAELNIYLPRKSSKQALYRLLFWIDTVQFCFGYIKSGINTW